LDIDIKAGGSAMPEQTPPSSRSDRNGRPGKPMPWHFLSVKIAIVVTVIGLGLWVWSLVSAPKVDAGAGGGGGANNSLVSGFGASDGGARSAASGGESPRIVDAAAPATFRFGASFLGGFTLAWLMKKFIKATLLIAGLAALAAFGLHKLGVFDAGTIDQVKDTLDDGLDVATENAGKVKDFLTGYLPSSAAAIGGLFVGFRRG